MKINYVLTLDDMMRAHRSLLWKNKKSRYTILANVIATIALPTLIEVLLHAPIWIGILIGIIFNAWYLVKTIYPKKRFEKRYKNVKGILGEHSIELIEDGVHEVTAYNNTFNSWESVTKSSQDSHFLYMYLGPQVYIIPKRNFASLDEADKFFQECLQKKEKHNS